MKLASYKDGSRDGHLVVVSRDLSQAHYAVGIATRLQQLLDDWNFIAPQLEELSISLNHGRARHAFAFEPQKCMAPLPRPVLMAEGQGWPAHGRHLRQLAGQDPEAAEPALRFIGPQLLGAQDGVKLASEAMGLDFGAQLLVVSGDLAQGASAEQALESVRLVGLANRWSLRALEAQGLALSHPQLSVAPVLVTPDELGEAWRGGRLSLPLQCMHNGRKVGQLDVGSGMSAPFGTQLAELARLRALPAGSLLCSGVVCPAEAGQGYASLADKRAREQAEGVPQSDYLKFGDSLRLEIKGRDGLSVFGAIDQDVVSLHEPEPIDASEQEA